MTGARIDGRISRVVTALNVVLACIPRWLAIAVVGILATAGKGCL